MTASSHWSGGALDVRIEQSTPMPLSGAFRCEPGEVLALVGPSGAGKTSMLRCIAGLHQPAAGRVQVGEQVWLDTGLGICLPPQRRHVGLVFQQYALMPHMSAIDNVALSLLHLPALQRRARAVHWLDHVRLSVDQQIRRPAALSGGEQQRVAVARALAREPHLLLLDEPFSAVDQMNRQGLYDLLADLRQSLRIPIVLVTHDLVEARHLADSLVVIDSGSVLQQGTPGQIYRSPRNARVADLVGVQNRFIGRWLGPQSAGDEADKAGWIEWVSPSVGPSGVRLRVRDKRRIGVGQSVTWVIQGDGLLIENEAFTHTPGDTLGLVDLRATVSTLRNLGETTLATLSIAGLTGVALRIMRSGPQRQRLSVGQSLQVSLACDWVHVMPSRDISRKEPTPG
jgi:molybdate transport system ATP-binding protein